MPVIFETVMASKAGPGISSCQAGEVRAVHGEYTVLGTEVATDIVHMVKLPAGHVPVDLTITTNGAGGTAAAKVGITDDPDGTTEDDDAFIASASLAAAGITRAAAVAGFRIPAVDNDRKVGLTLTAGLATAGQKIGLTLFYRSEQTYDL